MRRICVNAESIRVLSVLFLLTASPVRGAEFNNSTQTLRMISRSYIVLGEFKKAYFYAEKAVEQSNTATIKERALCLIDMGTVCYNYEKLDEAVLYFQQGIELQKIALTDDHPYVAYTLRMLTDVYGRMAHLEQAQTVLDEAFTIMQHYCGYHDKEMAPFIFESAKLKFKEDQLQLAQDQFEAALDLYLHYYGENHILTAAVQEQMAELYLATGDLSRADALIRDSLATRSRVFGRNHPSLVTGLLTMVRVCRLKNDMEKLEYYLAQTKASAVKSHDIIKRGYILNSSNPYIL